MKYLWCEIRTEFVVDHDLGNQGNTLKVKLLIKSAINDKS